MLSAVYGLMSKYEKPYASSTTYFEVCLSSHTVTTSLLYSNLLAHIVEMAYKVNNSWSSISLFPYDFFICILDDDVTNIRHCISRY
jgi:hypothetical protein